MDRENTLGHHQWHAGAKYPHRTFEGTPVDPAEAALDVVSMVKKAKSSMNYISRNLISRIEKEFHTYGAIPKEEQLIAMACNPLTATLGMVMLGTLSGLLKQHKCTLPEMDHEEAAKAALIKHLRSTFSQAALASPPVAGVPENVERILDDDDDDDDGLSFANALRQEFNKRVLEKGQTQGTDPVIEEVTAFFKHEINWRSYLMAKNVDEEVVKVIGMDRYSWMVNWELISQNFDIMEWWEETGKQQFPMIYVCACQFMALPESNGNQERTFSAATWMDGKLNKRQSDATFEMKCLIYKNTPFLSQARADARFEYKQMAAKATQQLLKDAQFRREMKAKGVAVIDTETVTEESAGEQSDATTYSSDEDEVDSIGQEEEDQLADIVQVDEAGSV